MLFKIDELCFGLEREKEGRRTRRRRGKISFGVVKECHWETKKIIIINKRKRQAILQGTERDSTTPSLSFSFLPGGR